MTIAFSARLAELSSDTKFDGRALLQAAVRAAPSALKGESRDEGLLAALAIEIARARDTGTTGDAFSVKFSHEGENEFTSSIAFREDFEKTILIREDVEDATVEALLNADLNAMESMVDAYDEDWIEPL